MKEENSINAGTYHINDNVHKITDYSCVSSDMQHTSLEERLYLHMDMNCFYAQVEQLCFNMYGMPVYIGGWYKENGIPRGIVATSSYEARAYGIKTGMSAFEAEQLCPYIIGLQAHYEKYKGISRQIQHVLNSFTMDVEKYSMDEYFLDINFLKNKPRTDIETYCQNLQQLIYDDTGLVCSIGVGPSKTYSKLASDLQKPRGVTIILNPQEIEEKLYPLDLDEVWGIGKNRYKKLRSSGLKTIGEAVRRGARVFQNLFGQYFGKLLYQMVAGKDRAKVLTPEDAVSNPKQLNYKHTFSDYTDDIDRVRGELNKAVSQLCYRMRGYDVKADKYYCFLQVQDRQHPGIGFKFKTEGKTNLDDYICYECMKRAESTLKRLLDEGLTMRGVGLGALSFKSRNQLNLFFTESETTKRFYLVQDAINNKYGPKTIQKAAIKYRVPGKTHFLDRS